jgi:hypothetical protein
VKRPALNLAVDAAAFVAFVLLTSTGVLLRYVLPPGSGRRSALWGLGRHEWGEIHFWISAAFLGALAIHILVHRRWIVSVVRGRPREGSGVRVALGLVGLLALLAAAAAPFFAEVENLPRGAGEHRGPPGFRSP